MTGEALTAWAYTVVFAATGAVALVLALRRPGALPRLLQGLHVLMSAGMIGMAWSLPVPAAVAIPVYGAATILLVALWARSIGPRGRSIADHPSWMLAVHAAMMAAMVWMSLPGGHDAAGSTMDGMTMSGHDGGHAASTPGLSLAIGLLLTVAVIAGTVLGAAEAVLCSIRRPPRWQAHIRDDAVAALMGGGMSVMMLTMVLA